LCFHRRQIISCEKNGSVTGGKGEGGSLRKSGGRNSGERCEGKILPGCRKKGANVGNWAQWGKSKKGRITGTGRKVSSVGIASIKSASRDSSEKRRGLV